MRLFLLVALAVVTTASSASASVLGSFVRKGPIGAPVINSIEDSNAEYIVKGAGNSDLTKFEVGDSVVMYLSMETISSSDGFFTGTPLNAVLPPAGGPGYNMLGKGVLTVTSIGPEVAGKATFQFAGQVDFVENSIGLDYNFNAGIAATDAVFNNAANTAVLSVGTVAADDFITALNAPVAFGSIPTFGTAVKADFGLSVISSAGDLGIVNNFLPSFLGGAATGNLHAVVGQVDTFALLNASNTIGDDKFDLRTNTDINFASQVPEPGSFAVFLGVAGLLGLRRRKVS